jgi:hypothetical protein
MLLSPLISAKEFFPLLLFDVTVFYWFLFRQLETLDVLVIGVVRIIGAKKGVITTGLTDLL